MIVLSGANVNARLDGVLDPRCKPPAPPSAPARGRITRMRVGARDSTEARPALERTPSLGGAGLAHSASGPRPSSPRKMRQLSTLSPVLMRRMVDRGANLPLTDGFEPDR